jgi:hypothetical protein
MVQMMTSKTSLSLLTLALTLAVGVFLFPTTAHGAATGDSTPPVLTASVAGDELEVKATDDIAVAAVYIDGHRVGTLVDGVATVLLKDYAGRGRQVTVYATDAANNRSEPITLDNPYYQVPVALPAPSVPLAVASASAANTQATSDSLSASASSETTGSANALSGADTSATSASSSAIPTATDTSATDTSDDVSSDGQNAFTPSGGGTVQDVATDEDGKEFYTITATDGSVYYLIVDRLRGTENVYFLTAVTKDDLAGLAQDAGVEVTPEITSPDVTEPTREEATQTEPSPEPEQSEEKKDSGMVGTVIFILIAAVCAGAVGYYFKVLRPRRQTADEEDEYDEDDEYDEEDAAGEGPDGEDYFFEEDAENE